MAQLWTIWRTATGEVARAAVSTASASLHPKDAGHAWDASLSATAIAQPPKLETEVWNGSAWVEDPAKVQALLLTQVKAENEARVKTLYSQNYGKQKKYSRKQQEVLDFRSLNGALGPVANALTAPLSSFLPGFALMMTAQQKRKFRFSMAQARLRGVTIDVIIGEIEAKLDAVEDQVALWEAVELEAIRSIKAAPTAAGKRAAYAAINWSWT